MDLEAARATRVAWQVICRCGRGSRVVRLAGATMALAASTAVHADGLTISGLVGAGPTYVSNASGAARYGVDTAPNRPNYLAFNGSESLGGGASAYFRLSGRFFSDSGQSIGQLFNAASYVGLRDEKLGDLSLGLMRDFMFDYFTAGGFSGAWHGGLWGASQGPFTNFGGLNAPFPHFTTST